MAASNRAGQFSRLYKHLKKKYQPILPPTNRSLLEHMLYACCLEDSKYDAADEAFARLQQDYFDWNEIRVTTVHELADAMSCLANPKDAAIRLKKTLHSMFEVHYSFDIEQLKKENLGKAVQHLSKFAGITPFVTAYVTQASLGGHAIAIDSATASLFYILDMINEKEAAARQVPGLERAIPKNKGAEFFSLLHQLAAALNATPFSNDIRKVVLDINRDAKDRLPKRGGKKSEPEKPTAASSADGSTAAASAKKKPPRTKKAVRGAAPSRKPAKKKALRAATANIRMLSRKKPR